MPNYKNWGACSSTSQHVEQWWRISIIYRHILSHRLIARYHAKAPPWSCNGKSGGILESLYRLYSSLFISQTQSCRQLISCQPRALLRTVFRDNLYVALVSPRVRQKQSAIYPSTLATTGDWITISHSPLLYVILSNMREVSSSFYHISRTCLPFYRCDYSFCGAFSEPSFPIDWVSNWLEDDQDERWVIPVRQ
jgi:hypothetical protein